MDGHVLQVITDTDRRGAQTFGVDLGGALTERGLDVRTVALTPGRSDRRHDVPVLGDRQLGLTTLAALHRAMARATVVVAHGSRTLPACVVAGVGLQVPVVYRNIGDPTYWAGTPLRRARVRAFLRRTSAVVALWPGSQEALITTFGVPDHRIRVIPNGTPADRWRVPDVGARSAAHAQLGLDPARQTVAYVGALSPEKDVRVAIEAVALTDAQLIVAGDGPLRDDLETLADRCAPGRIRFLGVADPRDVYAAADVVALTSRSEGMPAVLIEAGLSGLGSVTTDVGAVREVVADGVSGEVVPDDDVGSFAAALVVALQRTRSYGAAARERCLERFEMGVVATPWARLLEELASGDGTEVPDRIPAARAS